MEEILKRLRILVVSQYFWPENFRINDWVDGMVELGHEVTVLTSLPNYPEGILNVDYKNNPEKYTKYKDVEIIRVPQILRGNSSIQLFLNYISFAFFGSTFGVWKLRKKSFDASFVFAVSPILVVIPAIVLKITKKVPILLWVLDLWPDVLKSIGIVKSKYILFMLSKCVAFLYNRCDCIVAQSSMFLEDIKKLVPKHKNIDHIPSWSEQVCLNSNDVEIENIILNRKGKFNVFYTGNIGEAQDFETVIETAKQLKTDKDIKWFIIGNGRKAHWLKNQIKINNLEDSFYMLGAYPIEKMAVFFKHADVGLLCLKDGTLSKTIPGKLQTYFAYSLPVIGACNGEVNKIVNESNSGLIGNAGDSSQLAKNIFFMKNLTNKKLIKMSENANEYYTNNFKRDSILLSFDKKLQSLLI